MTYAKHVKISMWNTLYSKLHENEKVDMRIMNNAYFQNYKIVQILTFLCSPKLKLFSLKF